MPSNSLPDADPNLPEMKTKSPSCPAGGVHMYDDPGPKRLTVLGRNDPPQKMAEMTQGRKAETTRIPQL